MKKVKYKLGWSETVVTIALQNWLLQITNARLISRDMNRLCRKFAKDVKDLYLSEELQ